MLLDRQPGPQHVVLRTHAQVLSACGRQRVCDVVCVKKYDRQDVERENMPHINVCVCAYRISLRCVEMGMPSMKASPEVGGNIPLSMLMVVDLPAP